MIYCKQLVASLVCFLLVSRLAFSQPRDGPIEAYERQSEDFQRNSESVKRRVIEPIVAALKRKAEDDPQMLRLLNRIEFTITPHAMRPANAYATGPSHVASRGTVEVDLGWFNQSYAIATLAAATLATNRAKGRKIAHQAGFKYGYAIGEALRAGRTVPNFIFRVKEYVSDPLELAYVRLLSVRITSEAMAWIILHEIAHHKLGHLTPGRYDTSNATSRKLELEADDWAYKKMQEVGIPHFGVLKVMQMMDLADQIRARFGIVVEEAQSTHPSWSSRIAHLETKYDPMKVTTGSKYTTFTTIIDLADPGDVPAVIRSMSYIFPRKPVTQGCLAFVRLEKMPVEIAITEMRDGSMHLLQASPGLLIDVTIISPERTITQVVTTITNRATGAVTQSILQAWEQPWTLFGEVTKEGIRVGEGIQTTMRSFFIDFLRQTINDHNVLRRAIYILDQKLQSDCDIAQRFGRGQMSRQEILRRNQADMQQYQENLKAVLGERDYAHFQSNMMASPFAQASMRQLQKLLSAPQH